MEGEYSASRLVLLWLTVHCNQLFPWFASIEEKGQRIWSKSTHEPDCVLVPPLSRSPTTLRLDANSPLSGYHLFITQLQTPAHCSHYNGSTEKTGRCRVQELCESRGGCPGISILMSLTVSVDVKQHWTALQHLSQFVPSMSTDTWGHEALLHHQLQHLSQFVPSMSTDTWGHEALLHHQQKDGSELECLCGGYEYEGQSGRQTLQRRMTSELPLATSSSNQTMVG